jgi:curved DNA-binding protein CbpA
MTAPTNLDLEGNFQDHPLAELLIEIKEARLDGSLRLSRENQKVVVYFGGGEVVFAVSNSRSARLSEILLRENKIEKNLLSENADFAGDLEFARVLIEKKLFGKKEIDEFFIRQIEEILRDALQWETGSWTFSPHVRIRQDIRFRVGTSKILLEYARTLSLKTVFQRFRSSKEVFLVKDTPEVNLQSHEAFVLSRFNDSELNIDEIKDLSALSDAATLHTLYALWLGGFLIRREWNSAFTEHRVETISSARLTLKRKAVQASSTAPKPADVPPPIPPKIEELIKESKPADEKTRLEDYLERIEKSHNFYESLAVEVKASSAEIKQSYFALAKQFHPDRFHREADTDLHGRIQKAFTVIAKAYDTLRNEDSRSAYDFKIRKELAQMQTSQTAGAVETDKHEQADVAAKNFDEGYSFLMNENYAAALPFLARAVHLAPDVARYHAYYGKVLSADEKQRFKAESELQTAVKLEPENPTFRIILAEFYIEYNLYKRAEGELKRFLAIVPDNYEAQTLLDSLQKK